MGEYRNQSQRNPQMYGRHPQYGYDKIKERVNTELSGPQLDLPPLDTTEKKFNASSRLFVGNLPRDIPYEELKEIFSKYGELGQVYFNKDGAYAFINFDYRANAERAKRELQGEKCRNRPMKIRHASVTTGVRVKNLTPCVSNELLEKAFNVFGQIEACRVIVDDRGKPTGDGIVIFADKKGPTLAVKKCQEECYFLTSALRPVIVEPLEARDEEEGQPESTMHKNEQYKEDRKQGPRFADKNSFEYEYGMRWKRLYEMYKEKKMLLESDLLAEMEQLERRLAIVRHEHETEMLRRELMLREQEALQMGRSVYGRQGSYGGMDRYQGSSGDRYGERYDNMRDERYQEERYQRMQEERYQQALQEEQRYQNMRNNTYQQGATTSTEEQQQYQQTGTKRDTPAPAEEEEAKRTRY